MVIIGENYKNKVIQKIAYFYWLNAGKPEANDTFFWTEAEKKVSNMSEIELLNYQYQPFEYDAMGNIMGNKSYVYSIQPVTPLPFVEINFKCNKNLLTEN